VVFEHRGGLGQLRRWTRTPGREATAGPSASLGWRGSDRHRLRPRGAIVGSRSPGFPLEVQRIPSRRTDGVAAAQAAAKTAVRGPDARYRAKISFTIPGSKILWQKIPVHVQAGLSDGTSTPANGSSRTCQQLTVTLTHWVIEPPVGTIRRRQDARGRNESPGHMIDGETFPDISSTPLSSASNARAGSFVEIEM